MAFSTTVGNTVYYYTWQGDTLVFSHSERLELNPRHADDHSATAA